MTKSILVTSLIAFITAVVTWWMLLLVMREINFKRSGGRRSPIRGTDLRRSEEVEYHNLAIYRDFEFFFKVTLAIVGGIAYVATRPAADITERSAILVFLGGWLQLFAGTVFSLFILFHQKSKIERWESRYSWWEVFAWQEFWMVATMLVVSSALHWSVVPLLVTALAGKP